MDSTSERRSIRAPWGSRGPALSPLGLAVAVAGLLTAVLGRVLAWQEFVLFGLSALVLIVLALGWVLVPGQPEVRLVARPHRVRDGQTGVLAVMDVRAGPMPLVGARIELPYGASPVLSGLPFLMPFARASSQTPLPARPRGAYPLGPARYVKSDPVGLARREIVVSKADLVLVHPTVLDVPLFAPGLNNDLEGSASAQLSMSDLAFHALREYRPGDDLRHVHWRSSAKAARLQVRQYHTSRRGHVTVLLDHDTGSYPSRADFELAVSAAASLALRATRDDLDVYLRCGEHLFSGRQPEILLDRASAFRCSDSDYRATVSSAATATPATGLVVQVSGAGRAIRELRAAAAFFHCEARLFVCADTRGQAGVVDVRGERELTVSTLAELGGLLARSRR